MAEQSKGRYSLILHLENNSFLLLTEYGVQIWYTDPKPKNNSRKCVLCGKDTKGTVCYRPVWGNGKLPNVHKRMCKDCMDGLEPTPLATIYGYAQEKPVEHPRREGTTGPPGGNPGEGTGNLNGDHQTG